MKQAVKHSKLQREGGGGKKVGQGGGWGDRRCSCRCCRYFCCCHCLSRRCCLRCSSCRCFLRRCCRCCRRCCCCCRRRCCSLLPLSIRHTPILPHRYPKIRLTPLNPNCFSHFKDSLPVRLGLEKYREGRAHVGRRRGRGDFLLLQRCCFFLGLLQHWCRRSRAKGETKCALRQAAPPPPSPPPSSSSPSALATAAALTSEPGENLRRRNFNFLGSSYSAPFKIILVSSHAPGAAAAAAAAAAPVATPAVASPESLFLAFRAVSTSASRSFAPLVCCSTTPIGIAALSKHSSVTSSSVTSPHSARRWRAVGAAATLAPFPPHRSPSRASQWWASAAL